MPYNPNSAEQEDMDALAAARAAAAKQAANNQLNQNADQQAQAAAARAAAASQAAANQNSSGLLGVLGTSGAANPRASPPPSTPPVTPSQPKSNPASNPSQPQHGGPSFVDVDNQRSAPLSVDQQFKKANTILTTYVNQGNAIISTGGAGYDWTKYPGGFEGYKTDVDKAKSNLAANNAALDKYHSDQARAKEIFTSQLNYVNSPVSTREREVNSQSHLLSPAQMNLEREFSFGSPDSAANRLLDQGVISKTVFNSPIRLGDTSAFSFGKTPGFVLKADPGTLNETQKRDLATLGFNLEQPEQPKPETMSNEDRLALFGVGPKAIETGAKNLVNFVDIVSSKIVETGAGMVSMAGEEKLKGNNLAAGALFAEGGAVSGVGGLAWGLVTFPIQIAELPKGLYNLATNPTARGQAVAGIYANPLSIAIQAGVAATSLGYAGASKFGLVGNEEAGTLSRMNSLTVEVEESGPRIVTGEGEISISGVKAKITPELTTFKPKTPVLTEELNGNYGAAFGKVVEGGPEVGVRVDLPGEAGKVLLKGKPYEGTDLTLKLYGVPKGETTDVFKEIGAGSVYDTEAEGSYRVSQASKFKVNVVGGSKSTGIPPNMVQLWPGGIYVDASKLKLLNLGLTTEVLTPVGEEVGETVGRVSPFVGVSGVKSTSSLPGLVVGGAGASSLGNNMVKSPPGSVTPARPETITPDRSNEVNKTRDSIFTYNRTPQNVKPVIFTGQQPKTLTSQSPSLIADQGSISISGIKMIQTSKTAQQTNQKVEVIQKAAFKQPEVLTPFSIVPETKTPKTIELLTKPGNSAKIGKIEIKTKGQRFRIEHKGRKLTEEVFGK